MAVLEIMEINKNYGNKTVLDKVSLFVAEGQICGLLGLNGAGKSTLMKIVCGLARADGGKVRVNGKNALSELSTVNRDIGCVIESPAFYGRLTARQNLSVIARLCGGIEGGQIQKVLEETGLTPQADTQVRFFSMGMKQRLYFASALLKNPKLLILDEPFNGIDPLAVKLLRMLIQKKAAEGCAVLISSHILLEIANMCNSVCIIDKGKNVYYNESGMPDGLEDIFLSAVTGGGMAQ